MVNFEELKGKIILKIEGLYSGSEEIIIWTSDGMRYSMFHDQNCCEHVSVEDIDGCAEDFVGYEVLMAEESSNSDDSNNEYESCTWTFYRLGSIKGYMTIRWLGVSNGYYSESVSVYANPDPEVVRVLKIEKGLE